ncbi:three component ABC system middle component [Aeromonas caviae]|uniref:three component ABC system middle component n=1 Tax=Aeromonas caviae TaxID=648 RepID=UPI002B45BF37|nr:three component ABC system middle component [Aeromonas caviae]
MSSIVDALYELKYNPFVYGPYLASFYSALDESESNILLAPLVIPLCSHPIFGKKIYNSKKNSTIWSVFDNRTKLYDLQERIDGFQDLTEECLQYCLVNDWLSVNEPTLSLRKGDDSDASYINQRIAEKLGKLLSDHTVVEIYAFLGVKPR